MFSYSRTLSHFSLSNIIIWLSMAFQAGAINAGGYLASHRFVSHVTGFGTLVGTHVAQSQWESAVGMLLVPAFFILGAMVSAFLIDRRIQKNKKPFYPLVLFAIQFLMMLVALGGNLNWFGEFGAPIVRNDYILLAALCFACGLQNATITSAFGAVVRTTHLTGITTDLGIGIIRIATQSHKIQPRENEIRANWMRFGLILSFILGSLVSSYAYLHIHYWGFLIPAAIATILLTWSLLKFHETMDTQHD